MDEIIQKRIETTLFIIILIAGAVLRLVALDSTPPGMTHDEADHALSAAGVLQGERPIYFTVGYGREPLYDYVTSLTMLVVGQNIFASRLTAALFGIGLLVAVYVFIRTWTQHPWLALGAMAGLAVSFWGVSTSRQALRSVTLPFFFALSATAFRRGFRVAEDIDDDFLPVNGRPVAEIERWVSFIFAGLFLGLTGYTYLAARIMWLVYPAFFLFLSISQPGVLKRAWRGLLVTLVVAGIVASPLAYYLITNPSAEIRIGQLTGPVDDLLAGNPDPLITNVRAGLGMFTVKGDDLWLYNIPHKPLFNPLMSILFYIGISVAAMSIFYPYRIVHRKKRTFDEAFRISSANAFMLITLGVGLIPALVTGVGASNTRVIGLQPVLYYFPALGVLWLADWARRHAGNPGKRAMWQTYAIVLCVTVIITINQYFHSWSNARDVRVAYHTTLVETLDYIDHHPAVGPTVSLSTITPGKFHDPAVGAMGLKRDDLELRWFDGRNSLVFPSGEGEGFYFFPEIAGLDPALAMIWVGEADDQIVLRDYDFNRTVDVVSGFEPAEALTPCLAGAMIGDSLRLVGCQIVRSGDTNALSSIPDTLDVITLWEVTAQPDQELVLFTHVIGEDGSLIAQQDVLGYPTVHWQVGDQFAQLHRIILPDDLAGTAQIHVGAYTASDIVRLPTTAGDGTSLGDILILEEILLSTP